MALPVLSPISTSSKSVLPSTGTVGEVAAMLNFSTYTSQVEFLTGAAEQVQYTYRKLGGNVLDVELTTKDIYGCYEEAVDEYSYLINLYQAQNILSTVLGSPTASFDANGNFLAVSTASIVANQNEKYPKYDFGYIRRVTNAVSTEANVGGLTRVYSASITAVNGQQDYDLQTLVAADPDLSASVGNQRILVKKVFYHSPRASWRFYGYYGGLNVVGNMSTYGQYADDSTFEMVPTWQNKLQAMAFHDSLWTRTSHYSYELKNNRLRVFPVPSAMGPDIFLIEFVLPGNAWEEDENASNGVNGVNGINNIPFTGLRFDRINQVGKRWIRRWAFCLAKQILGLNRSKSDKIPIPGDSVVLNGESLISEAKEEMADLREEFKEILEETKYAQLANADAEMAKAVLEIEKTIPMPIFIG